MAVRPANDNTYTYGRELLLLPSCVQMDITSIDVCYCADGAV